MAFRQVMAASLALVMAVGTAPLVTAQQQGAISGRAVDEADSPYTHYTVQLRHPDTAQILGTQPLNGEGRFSFTGLNLQDYLVELIDTDDDNRLVCQEEVGIDSSVPNLEVNIDCGSPNAFLFLAAGAAGLVTAIGTLQDDNSNADIPQ